VVVVIYKWVPTIIILNILASQIWTLLRFINLVVDPLHQAWLSYTTFVLMMYIIQSLRPRFGTYIHIFVDLISEFFSNQIIAYMNIRFYIMMNGFLG